MVKNVNLQERAHMATRGGTILREGYLKKQGGRLKTWKVRWFVVTDDGFMRYYSDSEKKRAIGEFKLQGNELNVIPNDALDLQNDKFYFEIKSGQGVRLTDSHDSFLLCAYTEEERNAWVFVLKKLLYRHRGGAIFGHTLEETMEIDGRKGYYVPRIVQELVEFIYKEGLETEGIFRLSGRKKMVTQLIDEYDRGNVFDLSEKGVDVNTAASVLKNYLRQLPQPLIPFDRFEEMSTYGSKLTVPLDDMTDIYNLVRTGLNSLPKWNYNLLKYLITFFSSIAEKEHVNKMSSKNLAAIHAPNILRMENENAELMATVNMVVVETTLTLIENYKILFTRDFEKGSMTPENSSRGEIGPDLKSVGHNRHESNSSSTSNEVQKVDGEVMDSKKVLPTADYLSVMSEELKRLLASEQALRQSLEEKLILSNTRNEELSARVKQLESENHALQQKLVESHKRLGNLA